MVVVVLAPHGKNFSYGEACHTQAYCDCCVDAVVGVELFTTILAGKHMATVLPNCVLARHLQRLESFVTDITGVNPLSFLCFVPPH